MRFAPQHITLKNGKNIVIREAVCEDAQALIDAAKSYLRTSDYMCSYENEFNPTPEEEADWIKSHQKENSLLLVAVDNEKILATFNATGYQNRKMKHVAVLGISILEDWRGNGLGNILFESMISWAKKNPELEILVLETFSDNLTAINLYKKWGFTVDGVRKNYFRNGNENYSDNILMSLNVK
ncbi:GNAT family N-acetyltransferase [Prevotella sp. 10(H)]|uniref:GNAT family N-acetyltransferase n=1 Tax=Prevotella sp. 10(H) TaxID=1158294 RepID=UPI0004A70275|nr:GNAT family N-acetyltransferase [Prevotella sp. 10(H)]